MPDRNYNLSKFSVGDVLPRDVRDAKGNLLAREGHVATSEEQLAMLLRNAETPYTKEPTSPIDEGYPARSPLDMVLNARWRLQILLANPDMKGFSAQVLRIAYSLRRACRVNADVALATILLCRDESYSVRHPVNVAIASHVVGLSLGLSEHELIAMMAAALTMNIAVSSQMEQYRLQKETLTETQRAEMRQHCEQGVIQLQAVGVEDALWLEIVRDHHERIDGSGYPAGKQGDEIGVLTQLVALADMYCARISERAYRIGQTPNMALRQLFFDSGSAFNQAHAALFIKTLGIYPPGTGVRLRNGSVAIVTHRGASSDRPKVSSLTTAEGQRLAAPIRRNEEDPEYAVVDVVNLEALGLRLSMEMLWGSDAIA